MSILGSILTVVSIIVPIAFLIAFVDYNQLRDVGDAVRVFFWSVFVMSVIVSMFLGLIFWFTWLTTI